jgi:hypothetical protein
LSQRCCGSGLRFSELACEDDEAEPVMAQREASVLQYQHSRMRRFQLVTWLVMGLAEAREKAQALRPNSPGSAAFSP